MKKLILAVLVIALVGGGVAFGQSTDSASLFLSGVVGDYVDISVNPTAQASNLLLNQGTSAPILVAEVVFSSNTPYEITVTTNNNVFQLVNGGDQHPYALQFNGAAVDPGDMVASGTFANNESRDVTVTYGAADPGLPQGTYVDTVTFTIDAQ